MNLFDKVKKLHIVGASGIGVSALAEILRQKGAAVSGSDIETTGHKPENVPADTELLIYSNAVAEDNPERERARELRIKEMSYPEALGEFISDKKVIAVAGTNGKTTTTAMIGWIMEKAGYDPTVIVGSKVLAWDSNAQLGKSEWVVIEADEYKRAFLNYRPDIAVITNIALDHLDYYKDLDDIKKAFSEFRSNLKPGGVLIENTVVEPSENLNLQVPGRFNRENAAAAAAAAKALGISEDKIRSGLASFTGTWRRFERVGKLDKAEIISDYAHHPDGVRVTLEAAAAAYKSKKILAVFQPHQHNRTKKLFKEFVSAFCGADYVNDFVISEIFDVAGREENKDQDVSSKDLVREIQKSGKNVSYASDLADCEKQIRDRVHDFDAIIIMGAGDIYKVADDLVEKT